MRFENQVAVVTGGASGIGRATALAFAAEGAAVVVADLQVEAVENVAAEIRQAGAKALAQVVNVADREAVQNLVDRTVTEFGRLDVMVTCAGIARSSPVLTHREDH